MKEVMQSDTLVYCHEMAFPFSEWTEWGRCRGHFRAEELDEYVVHGVGLTLLRTVPPASIRYCLLYLLLSAVCCLLYLLHLLSVVSAPAKHSS